MNLDEYVSMDAVGLAERVRTRQVTPAELLDCAIRRADEVEPSINALAHRLPDLGQAMAREGLPPGPLNGVPFLLKDLVPVQVEGWPLTNGCRLFRDHVSVADGELVTRYKKAGLVLWGRTTTPEFGMSTTTTSSLFGVTRNPWDRSKSAGGSSGGSAAAVAAGVVPAAHGSDTGGSIRAPAGRCGVFGLKPSRGRVGQPGRIPHPLTVEHALTRSVRDSAALLDAATRSPAGLQQESESFLEAIKRPPRPLRIGLQVTAANRALVDETCRLAAHEAAALCESLGHHVTAFEMKLDLSRAGALYSVLCSAGTLRALDARAAQIGRDWDGSDVEPISYQILDAARKDTARDYDAALDEANALSAVFAEQTAEFDVILSPTTATFTEPAEQASLDRSDVDGVMHAMAETAAFLQIFNVSGRPAMSVPVVWIDDLPVGVQFGAGFGQEALLLQLAAQLEQARPWFSRYARCLPSDG